MTDAITAIKEAIATIEAERDNQIAALKTEYADRIEAHYSAIALLGGKATPSRKPVAADKPKRSRAKRTADPKIAERRQQVLEIIESDGVTTAAEIGATLSMKKPHVALAIGQLLETGAIERIGKGRASTYSVVRSGDSKAEGVAAE